VLFTVDARDAPVSLPGNPSAADVEDAIEGHVPATGVLTGIYTR
jgi:phosphatidylethanolamine-binding protein (PEBP) family uncharacterized protein